MQKKNATMREYRKWREIVIEQLAADWNAALDYIQFAIEEYQVDKDTSVLLLSLRTFIESQGGIGVVAKRAGLDPKIVLKILSSETAPQVDMLITILNATGCRLSIKHMETERPCTEMGDVDAPVGATESAATAMELTTDKQ